MNYLTEVPKTATPAKHDDVAVLLAKSLLTVPSGYSATPTLANATSTLTTPHGLKVVFYADGTLTIGTASAAVKAGTSLEFPGTFAQNVTVTCADCFIFAYQPA